MAEIKQVQFQKLPARDEVVETLERWLRQAQAGELVAVAVAGVKTGGVAVTEFSGVDDQPYVLTMLSAITILKARFLRSKVEGC